jgi:hypothetical protein
MSWSRGELCWGTADCHDPGAITRECSQNDAKEKGIQAKLGWWDFQVRDHGRNERMITALIGPSKHHLVLPGSLG